MARLVANPGTRRARRGLEREIFQQLADPQFESLSLRQLTFNPLAIGDYSIPAYRSHPDTFFGVHLKVGGNLKSPFDLFEWFHENHVMSAALIRSRSSSG